LTAEEKAADRRRRNREASSRSYYNRKARIACLEMTLVAEKVRVVPLVARKQALLRESALLKQTVMQRLQNSHACDATWM
jgi:hypothetical protein